MTINNQMNNQITSARNELYAMASNAGYERTNQASSSSKISAQIDAQKQEAENRKALDSIKIEDLNKKMKEVGTNINFSYNDDISGLVVTVKEAQGGKIIREIPTKEAIQLVKRMNEVVGLIFDSKA